MIMKDLAIAIMKIAEQNPNGFTISLSDLKPITTGFAIAHKETQNSFGLDGLYRVIEFASRTTNIIGGWNAEKGFYFDAVMIVHDLETALMLKEEHEQLAIYHIDSNTVY